MKEIIIYIILGIVQGITEVLPISSSAHLLMIGEILDVNVSITFEVFLHLGSLIAIVLFLRKQLITLVIGCYKYIFNKNKEYKNEFLYVVYILLSTIIVSAFSLIVSGLIDIISCFLWIVGLCLIINGIMIFIFSNIKIPKTKNNLTFKDAIVIGVFESFGVFPGISRSGACLSGASCVGLEKEVAANYTFMLFIPAVVGATILKLTHIKDIIVTSPLLGLYLISFLVTIFSTYIAFKLLLNIIRRKTINIFGYYTILLGLIIFIIYFK